MDIPSREDYHFVNGYFVPKSKLAAKVKKFFLVVAAIIGVAATPSTAMMGHVEPYTWVFYKTKYTEYVQSSNKNIPNKEAEEIVRAMFKWSTHFDIQPELLFAIAKIESRFDKYAISSAGAMGIMQVLYRSHLDKIVAAKVELGNPEIFSIDTNIYTGAKILRACLDKLKLATALAVCYNGGQVGNGYDVKVMSEMKRLGA